MYVILSLVLLTGLSWGAEYLGIVRMGIFAPMKEDVRRKVFENTQSYVEGKRQELTKYRLEYMQTTDPQSKRAIQMTVASSCTNLDADKITDFELRRFLECMRNGQTYQ